MLRQRLLGHLKTRRVLLGFGHFLAGTKRIAGDLTRLQGAGSRAPRTERPAPLAGAKDSARGRLGSMSPIQAVAVLLVAVVAIPQGELAQAFSRPALSISVAAPRVSASEREAPPSDVASASASESVKRPTSAPAGVNPDGRQWAKTVRGYRKVCSGRRRATPKAWASSRPGWAARWLKGQVASRVAFLDSPQPVA